MADTINPGSFGPNDDPRDIIWASVGEVEIDMDLQRVVDEARHKVFHSDWDWNLAEVPTVSRRPNGRLVVTEGQHRVLRRKEQAPGSYMWFVERPGKNGPEHEAAAAHGIATSRRSHSALAQWELALKERDEHAVAADKVLTEAGVAVARDAGPVTISAARSVFAIVTGGRRTPDEGADLLRDTLWVLSHAWQDDISPAARWEGTMLRAVAHLIWKNDLIKLPRLVQKLDTTSSADTWLKRAKDKAVSGGAHWHYLARVIAENYNTNMKREDWKLTW